jgi:hypothetical protein
VNILLVLILKIYILLTKGKFGGQGLLNYLIKGLFFNVIISMTLEAYIEFIIYGFLNLYTMDGKMSGEILGLIFSLFCIFLAIIFLPISFLFTIFTKNQKILHFKK